MSASKLTDEVATTCTVASLLISGYQIAMHLVHYNEPHIQLYILRILMMIPVYSSMTWLSIMMPKEEALYYNTIRDIYEAYVLYIFMQLLIHFLGGENSLIVHLEFKRRIKQPWPLNGLKPLQTDKIFFRRVKQGVLQFVLIKPITAILSCVFEHYGIYHDGHFEWYSGYMYLSGINNTSISLSLYCLVLFYMATEERLKPFSPFAKFLCIKAILFFSFWQACAFTVLLKMNLFDKDTANVAQSLIISVEMVFAAVAQSFAFNYKPFLDGGVQLGSRSTNNQTQEQIKNKNGGGNGGDVLDISALRATTSMFKNMGYVLNVKDVINDAHNTFIRGVDYKDSEQEMQLEDILKRDKAFNWSDEEESSSSITDNQSPSPMITEKAAASQFKKHKTPSKVPTRNSLGSIQKSTQMSTTISTINRHSMPQVYQSVKNQDSTSRQDERHHQDNKHNSESQLVNDEEGENVFDINNETEDDPNNYSDGDDEEEDYDDEDQVRISFDNNAHHKIKVASNMSNAKIVHHTHHSLRKQPNVAQKFVQQQSILQV